MGKREVNVEEFIKFCQGCMRVLDDSLKFTKLSMYVPSLVSDQMDEMRRFVTGG